MIRNRTLYKAVMPALLMAIMFSCNHTRISDIEGNTYKVVTIGEQAWMAENLQMATFRNGDPIPQAGNREAWKQAAGNRQPAWCYFNDDPEEGETYGKLYNWFAVSDPRGLAPEGWKIPGLDDWDELIRFAGKTGNAAMQLKSSRTWYENPGNNKTGFTALPNGDRDQNGVFHGRGISAYWWSDTHKDDEMLIAIWHHYEHERFSEAEVSMGAGLAVRCIKE